MSWVPPSSASYLTCSTERKSALKTELDMCNAMQSRCRYCVGVFMVWVYLSGVSCHNDCSSSGVKLQGGDLLCNKNSIAGAVWLLTQVMIWAIVL